MIILAVFLSLWLGVMLMAVLLPIKPSVLRITRIFVCPPGTEMEVRTFTATYHRPGERGLEVYAVGPEGAQDVKVKALWIFWVMCCVVTLPLAIYLADVLVSLFQR